MVFPIPAWLWLNGSVFTYRCEIPIGSDEESLATLRRGLVQMFELQKREIG